MKAVRGLWLNGRAAGLRLYAVRTVREAKTPLASRGSRRFAFRAARPYYDKPTGGPAATIPHRSHKDRDPMRYGIFAAAAFSLFLAASQSVSAADVYTYDGVHSSVSFKARHLGLSWIHGRFNAVDGIFTIDREHPEKSSFTLTIEVNSIDTANEKRDEHLLQADYFDVAKYPQIQFKSTKVKPIEGGYEVTGDFTMHGTVKAVTFTMVGGKEIEVKGTKRVGFSVETTLKRSDFGFDPSAIGPIGDEAVILIDCEGMRK
jgi:polyisoprenoid-binding protein YceI